MNRTHIALAVLTTAIWGSNFVAIKIGLAGFPPFLFTALRFGLSALPFLLIYRHPGTAWKWVIGMGLALGVGQFGLLFWAMQLGMPAGLSSAVLQTQVFFTLLFSLLLGERPNRRQLAGMSLAFCGVLVIAGDLAGGSLPAFLMLIAAAACWAFANILTRLARAPNALRLMTWVSVVPVLPMLLLSWAVEGRARIEASLSHIGWHSLAALAYVSFGATLVGYGLWSHLLKLYPARIVAPYSLLVPLFGLSTAALMLHENPGPQKLAGAALIILGVAANSWPQRKAGPA
ncbi:putative amino-acid metabolite efflux pump [mine drainage metagenome]|uniref:Putative amino-acid metabolite efflux pump n=1 Tax=mine drainage metagenome TaxID=410659 RepID=A0A1J5RNP7_9ZZZZ